LEERWNVILEPPQSDKWSPLCFSFPEKKPPATGDLQRGPDENKRPGSKNLAQTNLAKHDLPFSCFAFAYF